MPLLREPAAGVTAAPGPPGLRSGSRSAWRSASKSRPGWRRPAVVRAVPAAVLLALGLAQLLQDRPLWYDEAYSRLAAGVPLGTLIGGVWRREGVVSYLMDVPPSFNGPYYVVLHGWVLLLGDSAFSLRLASLGCAVVAVAVLAELVRRLAGPGAGLLAGTLVAAGPLLVDETTQARSYGAALLAVCLCALWQHDWHTTGRHLRRSVVAAGVAALLHWFTIPVLAGFAALAVLRVGARARAGARGGRRAACWLLGACAPAAALVAWSMLGGTYGAPHPVPVGAALPVQAVRDWSHGSALLALALVVAAAGGLWRSPHRLLLLCWVVVPAVLITGVELVRPTYYPRYLLFTLVGLVAAAALGVAAIRSRRVRWAVAGVLVALTLQATVPTLDDGAREPTPAAIAYLAARQVAGQPIVPADGRVSLDLETYLSLQPRLADDLVLPPELFTDQTTSETVWLVRVVLKENSLPVVDAEQRLVDAGWTQQDSTLLVGTTTNLRVERWTR